jgi:hypothetical protein
VISGKGDCKWAYADQNCASIANKNILNSYLHLPKFFDPSLADIYFTDLPLGS